MGVWYGLAYQFNNKVVFSAVCAGIVDMSLVLSKVASLRAELRSDASIVLFFLGFVCLGAKACCDWGWEYKWSVLQKYLVRVGDRR
mmetsp:Transcript_40849/g.65614  ORF Transcript_40849/g.65614 Transcript_40849/m.65614 type:complete len:86 (+) Transcript_40849:1847-2104(+)